MLYLWEDEDLAKQSLIRNLAGELYTTSQEGASSMSPMIVRSLTTMKRHLA